MIDKFKSFQARIGISWFEVALFAIAFISGTIFTFSNTSGYQWYDWVLYVDILVGIVAAISLSKKWKWSWILLAFDAILYGSALIGQNLYVTGIINAIIIPFILSMTLITWRNHKSNESSEIETQKLNFKYGFLLSLFAILLTAGIGGLLTLIDKNNTLELWRVWIDSFLGVLTLFAFIFSIFRLRETWYIFFFANTVKVILFTTLLAVGDANTSPLSLILALTYWINAVYGLVIWRIGKKVEFKRKATVTAE